MNFFILGCNGMAGHIISLFLKEQGHSVLGFARSKSKYVESIVGDAFDTELLRKIIKENEFDVVVNCIGMLNQFAEQDKASASFLNSYLPHFLAEITADTETQIIHMSTDCVFSGKQGSYAEDAFCDGETFYDRSKALGELVDLKNLTLRNSIVGPDINPKGIGLLNWFMQQNGEINGFTKSIWTGQTTLQLAKTIEKAALEKAHGLYNAVPDHSISKYKLVMLFDHYLRADALKINPIEGILADKSLIRTKYEFDYLIPNYEIMVAELADWMKNHRDMYPHYNLSN
jgi:dTDP-4-dehydrorhamnose reductase